MTQHQINEMRARRYSALSLPLRESMLMAQQNREDATQADELAGHAATGIYRPRHRMSWSVA